MTMPEKLTLDTVKKSEKLATRVHRASDFLANDQKIEIQRYRANKKNRRPYDAVDAYVAEILARFGYEAYQAWQGGDFPPEKMARLVAAERARERQNFLGLEGIIIASVAGANHPAKGGHTPKSLKTALKIFKREQSLARGVNDGE